MMTLGEVLSEEEIQEVRNYWIFLYFYSTSIITLPKLCQSLSKSVTQSLSKGIWDRVKTSWNYNYDKVEERESVGGEGGRFIRIFLFYNIVFQMIREADADGDGKVGCSILAENINPRS